MPQMTDERVRAGLAHEEDLSLLNEVSMKTAGVSHLEMCIQCGTCGGSCPAAQDMDHTPRMLFAMLRAGMRGRSFEFGLASRHYLKHFPLRLPSMTPMGVGMLTKGRMALTPKKIKNMDQLTTILNRAKQLELTS